jgi:hypothetical protein
MKKKILRTIRNIAISIVVIIVVLVSAGLIYTWVVGKQTSPVVTAEPEETTVSTPTQRTAPADNATLGVSIQSLTSPVVPGENASVTIKTNPGAWCTIKVVYDKTPSKDSGLVGKTADEYGSASWTWTVNEGTVVGKWPVTVTCVRNKLSAVVIGNLVVTNQKDL